MVSRGRAAVLPLLACALAVSSVLGTDASRQAAEDARQLTLQSRAALAQIDGTIDVPGLHQPVEVVRDTWGVPHIYAQTVHDLFLAQGYVAAQDRLWQLDLWRRNADGSLAEVVGPSAIRRDTFSRLLRYRGDMDAEWRAYGPDAREIIESFVAGVNAQIDLVSAHPEKLPIEFQLLGVRPQRWTPNVVIGRMAGYVMTRNARSEVQRARLMRTAGVERVNQLMPVAPTTPITVPDGLDLADITDNILDIASDASEVVRFPDELTRGPVAAPGFGFSRPAGIADGRREAGDAMDEPWADSAWQVGSNNWVLSGSMTASQKPILANDPHRVIALPSLRYSVHLVGPGWNVIGAGEPALPGVAAGHNDRVAFGFTIVGMDQQDLYVEKLDPALPDHYFSRGVSEPMKVEREEVRVRGQAPRQVELRFTSHGPVLALDTALLRAYVLRWVGSEPGSAGYLRSLALNRAQNWQQFREAVAGWKVPSENLIYADVDGNIGWVAAGLAPVRPNWNGLLPVPGDQGRYEWSGFLGIDDLPQAFNPAAGYIATANHNILPPGYSKVLGYEWGAPYRFNRISEVLNAAKASAIRLTVADSERLQHDATSLVARAVCDALRAARASRLPDPTAGAAGVPETRIRALDMLTSWNHVLGKDSAAAALFEVWLPRVSAALVRALASPADRAGDTTLSTARLLALLGNASGDPRVQDALVGPALDEAWQNAVSRMGPDSATWAWGRIHRAHWEHPLAGTPARSEVFNLPDVARGGDGTVPFATGSGIRQTAGASFREVIDLGNWDRSTMINVPGQSAQPGSPFYGNLLPLWAGEQYHPMLFSREAVRGNTAARLVLKPATK